MEVVVGNEWRLRCQAKGYPRPETDWYHNGGVLLETGNVVFGKGNLVVKNVTQGDGGKYACRVMNDHGVLWANVTVAVVDPSIYDEGMNTYPNYYESDGSYITSNETSKPFWVKPSVMRIQMVVKTASSPVSLRCPAAGNPMPNITWLRNGEPLVETWRMTFKVVQKRWALSFASVTKAYEGDYTCVVANVYGSIQWTYSLEVIGMSKSPIYAAGSKDLP
ncbi:PREDICTED: fibroblast growth factor receptor 3-like [Priapulus caudatus]|uniref:Fibroblast growth factor receptor 3-like n=1 Tax=Priapulus caudatus TaxID=37621 RepID=A0ABM1EUS6_PRICU|nr:PREDICTED: fibroblast growth factor receptor 3-like [Priapulus caudatus]